MNPPFSERELAHTLGSIEARMDSAEKSRDKLYEKIDALANGVSETNALVKGLKKDHEEIRDRMAKEVFPTLADYNRMKNRGTGFLIGVAIAAGSTGAVVSKYFTQLFK